MHAARSLDVRLVWLSNEAYSPTRGYLLRTGADLVPVVSLKIEGSLDLDTLELNEASTCEPNGIAEARIDSCEASRGRSLRGRMQAPAHS